MAISLPYRGQGVVRHLYVFRTPDKRIKFSVDCNGYWLYIEIALVRWECGGYFYLRGWRKRGA